MSRMVAVNDVMSTELTGEFSSKRGLMRIANAAVRARYEQLGLDCPRQPSFDLFTGYSYTRSESYSPITFGDDGSVRVGHMMNYRHHIDDMSEVAVALYLAAHGPGMYRVMRSGEEPSADRYGYSRNIRLTFLGEGEDCAAKAASIMHSDEGLTHILEMQFISNRFCWDEGYNRADFRINCVEKNGHTYSRHYWDANNYTCPVCGEDHALGDEHEVWRYRDGELHRDDVCDTCYQSLDLITEEIDDRTYDRSTLPDGFLTVWEGHTIRTDDLDRVGRCDSCGALTLNLYRRGLKHYCRSCRPRDLMNYGHTDATPADFRSVGDSDSALNLYLGVELETQDDTACDESDWASTAKDVAELDTGSRDYVATKRDGSLSSCGVEIVSMPATPLFHLTNDFWGDLLAYANDRGVNSNSRCGLHIHVNHSFFNDSYRLSDEQVTVDRLVSHFAEQWRTFSRRTRWNYCEMHSDDDMGLYPEDCVRRKRTTTRNNLGRGHYTAVNHGHDATVEFRFFAGTLDIEELKAALEAAAGLAIMAKTLGRSGELMETWTWSDMRFELSSALTAHGIPCKEFNTYCDKRGL